jgi:hypothetical protein
MSDLFNRDRFADALGSLFTMTAAGGKSVDLELAEVSELKQTKTQQAFSIVFLAPEPFKVEQGLYDLKHETMGPLQLFLVPVGMKDGRLQLEAVFNLLRENPPSANG